MASSCVLAGASLSRMAGGERRVDVADALEKTLLSRRARRKRTESLRAVDIRVLSFRFGRSIATTDGGRRRPAGRPGRGDPAKP
jgi:hypothetical protein